MEKEVSGSFLVHYFETNLHTNVKGGKVGGGWEVDVVTVTTVNTPQL